jgi:hypothetical protein
MFASLVGTAQIARSPRVAFTLGPPLEIRVVQKNGRHRHGRVQAMIELVELLVVEEEVSVHEKGRHDLYQPEHKQDLFGLVPRRPIYN